ncbi:MAG: hypothetical protein IPJ67_04385 [Candidatus Moraniibacteriota bacterium]|nr:MAG: hypothetical protein IPJ67_04385 [Candidatus Moranbacteria bacterium]
MQHHSSEQPRVGISVLSFFPRFLIPVFGYWSIFQRIKRADMGVQLTPTRCFWVSILSWILPKSVEVISLETAFPHEKAQDGMGPWYLNPRRLHWIFMKIDGYWPIFDLILFSARRKRTWKALLYLSRHYPRALQIDTRGILADSATSAEETSPKNADSLNDLIDLKMPLMLDTHHIRKFEGVTTEEILTWIRWNKTRFIGVQLQPERRNDREELDGFLKGDPANFLVRVVEIMGETKCPFIFEFHPRLFLQNWGPATHELIQLRRQVERIVMKE